MILLNSSGSHSLSLFQVLFLLGAVACHKFVMGFCLGLEFRSNPRASVRSQFIGISVFALGAVCGIGLGMLIVDLPANWSQTTLPIIQALAGGTLFYVTVCEVIPREKARWHRNSQRRWAGFAQFTTVIVGFATMCVINFYLAGMSQTTNAFVYFYICMYIPLFQMTKNLPRHLLTLICF